MPTSSAPVIELHDAYIMQDVNTVLQKVTFTLEKGEFAYLVGRTGSGKSSLLKTLYADLPLPTGTGTVVGSGVSCTSTGAVGCGVTMAGVSETGVPRLRS